MDTKADFWERMSKLTPEQRAMMEKRLAMTKQPAPADDQIPRRQGAEPIPLSYAQQRLWVLDQLDPDTTAYNMTFAVRLTGRIHLQALEKTLQAILDRHESLRTTFSKGDDGHPVQVIAPSLTLPLAVLDVQTFDQAVQDAKIRRLLREEAQKPFSLATGPLIRFRLIKRQEQEHVLLLSMHHIISDAWSIGNVFVREFAALYAAFADGKPSSLAALPIQFADFAAWQRATLQGATYDKQLSYWKEQLSDLAPLQLPTDRPRPPVQTHSGALHTIALDPELSDRLHKLSKRLGASLFMTLLSAYQALLSRWTGQEDIAVGTPIAGRNRQETEGLIGFFVGTLVMRGDLSGQPTFETLLERIKRTALRAYDHQDVPFDQLVHELQPERDMSRSPLFQVMFSLQNAPVSAERLDGLNLELLNLEIITAKFDLELLLTELPEGISATFKYNTDLFDAATIERMAAHYRTILRSIVEDPTERIHDMVLLPEAERSMLASMGAGAKDQQEYSGLCTHQLFAEQALKTPEHTALIFEEESLSYRDLDQRANRLAHHLQTLGAGPDTLVGLCLERSADLVVGLLGILKAGAAYVPIDPSYPSERVALILEDTQAPLLVTESQLLASLPAHQAHVVCLDADREAISRFPLTAPHSEVTPEHLAYMIYTSGSTGRPKAVMVEHRQLVSVLSSSQQAFGFSKGDIMPWIASVAFDIALFELLNPLLAGGTSVVLTKERVLEIDRLLEDMQTYTAIHTVPSLMRQIVQTIEAGAYPAFDRLRLIFIGGDAVAPDLLKSMQDVFRQAQIHVLYGPTEGTIICSHHAVSRTDPMQRLSIGKPLPHATLRVCDQNQRLVPIGVPGELQIGGRGVTRGYFRQAELTADKYIVQDGMRWYKTGDLVRWQADGTLEFLGRIDHQVKIRGFRIELGEIEAVLAQHEAVRETLVTVYEPVSGDKRLAAYFVAEDGGELQAAELRSYLRTRLPDYMVPAALVSLEAMPLNPNGKVDRKQLPDPELTAGETTSEKIAPRTETERQLVAIWSSVLRRETVGIHDNFFALGGDSILSIQIVHRAAQAGIRLKPRDLFQHQTIARLAEVAVQTDGEALLAEQGVVHGTVLLTPVQQWFFEQEWEDMHHFNMSLLFDAEKSLDQAAMREVTAHLMQHHDLLRARFLRDADSWSQYLPDRIDEIPFLSVDLSDLPLAERESAFRDRAAQWQASLDLGEGPLFRVIHADLGSELPERLLVVVHHLLVDGVSWRILLEDLETAYEQRISGASIQLPPKTTSFQRWAERLADYAQTDAVLQEAAHWTSLQQAGHAPLPIDLHDGDNLSGSTETVTVALSAEETKQLLEVAPQAYLTQINDLLLTAWTQAFAKWSGQPSLLLTLEGHGREEVIDGVDLSRTIGWFTATYPIALDLSGIHEVGSAIKAVKEQLRAVPNRGIGYGLLRSLSGRAELMRAMRELPQPEVSFNYLGQVNQDRLSAEKSRFTLSQASAGSGKSERIRREHLLEINGMIASGQLRMSVTYSKGIHHRATIERLAQSYVEAMQELIAHCARADTVSFTPSDLPAARLEQRDLDAFLAHLHDQGIDPHNLETLYPLSPMQQGMLYHSLLMPESGVYVTQVSASLRGVLDMNALQRAWNAVIERHPILRTGFHQPAGRVPMQAVLRKVEMPLELLDWQNESEAMQEQAMQEQAMHAFLRHDQERGFDPACAPLMRLTLIQTGHHQARLVWTSHHLLLDGWSMPIVFQEVFALYRAEVSGQELRLQSARPYGDYIAWLSAQNIEQAEQFWQARIESFAEPTLLGVERPSTLLSDGQMQYAELRGALSETATEALQQLAREHQLTLNTLVQGAWTILLHRYSGAEDVVFGATVAGRPADLEGVDRMIGLFINTLPVRQQLSAQTDVLTFLRQLQEEQSRASEYEYTPLQQIQAWSGLPRDLPLFHSILVFENYPMDQEVAASAELTGELQITDMSTAELSHYPLTVGASPGRQLALKIAYDRTRYDDSTIDLLHGHLLAILTDLLATPGQRVQDVRMMTAAEQELLSAWSDAELLSPPAWSAHQRFAVQAAQTPERIAILSSTESLTYRELNARSNRLAHHLRSLRAGVDQPVALYVERSLDLVVSLLAIWKAGAGYLPLDTEHPSERLTMILADAKPTLLITQSHLLAKLPASQAQVVCLDTEREAIANRPSTDPVDSTSPHDLAYMIYTSGSTGRPKAVMVEHHSLASVLQASQERFGFAETDVMPWIASAAFDIALFELINPLLTGGTSVVLSREQVLDLPKLTASLSEFTMLHTVPSLMRRIVETVEEQGVDPARFANMRTLFIGGDAVPPDLLEKMQTVFRQADIHVLYGPTEGTIICSHHQVTRGASLEKFYIGQRLPHVHLRICDPQGRTVPIGMSGELYIGGHGVTRGYYQQPELTMEKYVARDGERWYRTGDLARCVIDGTIEFLGRLDNQVKIRGFRIELGEVETALHAVEGVKEAVVVALTAPSGEKRLVAYIVPEAGETITSAQLRNALQARLPDYMIPSAFLSLDRLPLNPNGKVDRRALPVPEAVAQAGQEVALCTPAQEMIIGIWAELLGRSEIGPQENFFEAGGHSLLVTQVISRINELFGIEMQLRTLFEAPTVVELAAAAERLQNDRQSLSAPPIKQINRDGHLPLSFAQQRLWIVEHLTPGTSIYNMPFAVRLQGQLNSAALKRTLDEIISRHETLRTSFADEAGRAVQIIHPPKPLSLTLIDLTAKAPPERERIAQQEIETAANTPFDLSQGQLIRARLLQLDDAEHILIVVLHHIVADGWSMGVFMQELSALYRAFSSEQPSPLPAMQIQYADFAAWQREWLQGDVYDAQLSYWKTQLTGELPTLQLPTDRPHPRVQTHRGAHFSFRVDRETALGLKKLSRRLGATLFMTLLSAYQTLLARLSGQEDIVVGTPIAGRNRHETENLIGFFVNTLVLRTDLSGNPSFEELLARVRETALGAYAHQDLPFERLVEEIQPTRDTSRTPLFQTLFNVQQYGAGASFELIGLDLQPFEIAHHTVKFDLELSMEEREEMISGRFNYNTDLFDQSTIARMSAQFLTLLQAIELDPTRPVTDLLWLPEAESDLLLKMGEGAAESASADAEYDRSVLCTHQLFAEQAAKTPERTALIFEEESLSYRDLDQRANQLAHHLQALGAGPDTLVGLCLERSADLVVGLLGILKAGAAYVPIDPSYPSERVALILEDTQAHLLVTAPQFQETLPAHQARMVCLDADREAIARFPLTAPHSEVTPEHLAYMIYTSGSTGRPKAVMVEHRQLVSVLSSSQQAFRFSEGDIMPWIASVAFDIALFELMNPLLAGGTSVVLTKERVLEIDRLLEDMQTYTAIHTVPSLMRQIVQTIEAGAYPAFDRLRLIFIGGDAVAPDLLKSMHDVFRKAQIHVLYGPTEGTIICSHHAVSRTDQMQRLSIGKPLPHATLRVCDQNQRLVPIGVPGELQIGGRGVTRGYFRQAELTDDKYILQDGMRWYKTGDLVRWQADGTLEFLGRIDHQVKIRGFRIELGEIEAVLAQHEAVQETLVTVYELVPGDKRLVAYFVAVDGEELQAEELRSYLRTRLPDYMVPAAFVSLEAMPLNPNGKVDRKQLPDPDFSGEANETYTKPRNEIEQKLAESWAAVLRIEQVGIHDNFFALGGDSILSIQIVHRAAQQGIRLKPKDLFEHQTIAELALAVESVEETCSAEQGIVTGEMPLTPIQHQFFAEQHQELHHFNMPILLTLREPANLEALRDAIRYLLTHHDALRMRFAQQAGSWQQENADLMENVPLTSLDLTAVAEEEQESAFFAEANRRQGLLDLNGQLFHAVHVRFGGSRPDRLLLIVHHLIVDGVSWRILLEDLETLYRQQMRGESMRLSRKTTSYHEWAQRLPQAAATEELRQELDYWLRSNTEEESALPIDKLDGLNLTGSTATVSVSLAAEETKILLQQASQAYNTQINDLLLTALVQAFANWTGSRSLPLHFEGHGREEILDNVDLSRTVGWFTTVYPVCLQVPENGQLGAAIQAVKEQLRAVPNRGIGYGILRWLSDDADLRQQLADLPQPEVSFNYLGQFDTTSDQQEESFFQVAAGTPSGLAQSPGAKRSHLLDITSLVAGGKLQVNLIYSTNVHHVETIEGLADEFLRKLRAVIAHCVSPEAGGYTPSDFPQARLTQAELDRFLSEAKRNASDLEQVYELSPMQQGMLFHSLLTPTDGVYVTQLKIAVEGLLDIAALQQSWNAVLTRHSILRTAFFWNESSKPLQAVYRTCSVPMTVLDWREQSEQTQASSLEQFLREDAARGFEMTEAPLMRLTVIRQSDRRMRLIWTSHHLLLDGWSTSVVFKEVFSAYRAIRSGQAMPADAERPFRSFIAWLQEQDESAAETYWRKQLAGFLAPTDLRVENGRKALTAGEVRHVEQKTALPADLTVALQSFAKQQQLTLNTLAQGAWALLLSRYSGEEDVVFGATVSGRPADLPGVDTMVGLFINTLPVRLNLPGDTSLADCLQALQTQQAEMRQYEYAPLVNVQEWSDVPRGQPLFDTIFVFENYPVDQETAKSVSQDDELMIIEVSADEITNYPLTVTIVPSQQLIVKIAYDCLRYDDDTVERMITHLHDLLAQMVAAADRPLNSLRILSAEEAELLDRWNDNHRPYPHHLCAHELFDRQAERTPERTALVFAGESMSYLELQESANRLARHLQGLGVKPGLFVGYFGERTIEWAVAVLAIFKAGGIYVPLDPKYPHDRLSFMIEDTSPQVMLTYRSLVDRLPSTEASVLCLDEAHAAILEQSAQTPAYEVTPDDRAYVIFTSGSTGRPKGAMVEHKGMVNHLLAKVDDLTVTADDRIAQNSSQCVDISVWQLLTAWMVGAATHILPDEIAFDPAQQLEEMERSQLTIVETVPSLLRAMIDEVALRAAQQPDLSALRWMIPNGEVLPPELCRKWLTYYPKAWLINAYGPTECSDDVTHHFITELPDEAVTNIPIGRVIPNMKLYVLDKAMQHVPLGVPGELYIGGIGVGPGYLNSQEKTAETFLQDPFSQQDGARLYKTGDLVRFRSEGLLEFLGRIDNQVKIRGFRIEIGEIEVVLSNHPSVEEAIVIAREDVPGDKRLVAYLTAAAEAAIDMAEVRAYAQSKLTKHMVPSAIVVLESIPLTANGKVNRRALPKPDDSAVVREVEWVAARDAVEAELVEIWKQLLDLSEVGIHDNFFSLGGHSLLAVRLMSEIQKRFGQKLTLQSLYQSGTIEQLAESLRQGQQAVLPACLVELQKGSDNQRSPLFLIHPGGGMVHAYMELARELGSEQTVYGLQSQGVADDLEPLESIEEMATLYIQSLKAVQPVGPYLLGGWSLGGVVAYEMARQLHEQGELVADLILIDTPMPTWQSEREKRDEQDFLLMFANHWAGTLGEDITELIESGHLPEAEVIRVLFERGTEQNLIPKGVDLSTIYRSYNVFKHNITAQQNYEPQPYEGHLTLLVAIESAAAYIEQQGAGYQFDLTLGWAGRVAIVTSEEVPGEHSQLMEQPFVHEVGRHLSARLQDFHHSFVNVKQTH
ncbi:non-ribosomal peptide synthase/polyketide synthase [Tumebacillus lipolyticus]|uniref:Non-ribosomal peptide synthase/polyketide synthase n=1 Tax=Tumebacillus lipolyticus TaxID=1280370 RepID=A0ABW4ZSV5_9BACL